MIDSPIMLLLDTDMVLEPDRIRAAVADIHTNGFDSICIEFRNCMYDGFDQAGYEAFVIAAEEASSLGLKVVQILSSPGRDWLKRYPKHRRKLLAEYRGAVQNGRFSIPIERGALHDTQAKLAGIYRVFQVSRVGNRIVKARDITADFVYVLEMNAVPTVSGTYEEDGEVLLYAGFHCDAVDWASPAVMEVFDAQAELYAGLPIGGYAMDEFGTGTHLQDIYHAGEYFLNSFRERYGYDLLDKLYLLQNEVVFERAGKVRYDYYNLTMEHTYAIQKGVKERFAAMHGEGLFAGFHHTWWGEGNSGDLWAGNIDYFQLADNMSGGFVDAQYDAERTMTSMTMLAESIAKYSTTGIAYNMCWDRYPTHEKMDYYHRLLAVRNVRWIAHTYGRSGDFGPGYPEHRTWADVAECTRREKQFQSFIGTATSRPKVGLLYVWEAVANTNDTCMHYHRMSMKALLDKLMDRHIEVDIIPTFEKELDRYEALLVLWPTMMPESTWQSLRSYAASGGRLIMMGPPADCTAEGRDLTCEFEELIGARMAGTAANHHYAEEYEYIVWDMWFTDQKIPMHCYPMTPSHGEAVLTVADEVLGVKRRNVDYYAFEIALTAHFEIVLNSLMAYQELALPGSIRSKVSYEGDETIVLTLTGRWNNPLDVAFQFRGHAIKIRDGKLVGIKLLGDKVIETIGEYGEIEINGKLYETGSFME